MWLTFFFPIVCMPTQTIYTSYTVCVYMHLCVAVYQSPGTQESICRWEGGMASHSMRVGVKLRAPNYSPGSCSLPASPSAPVFGCIFPDRVR